MKTFVTVFTLLVGSAAVAHAAPITFEVEYTTLFNQYCFYHSGICVPRSLDSFTRTFTLESEQLMADGLYDVSASLDPAPTVTPPPDGTVTTLLSAFAEVADEDVVDLLTTFQGAIEETCFGFPKVTMVSFSALSGNWESATSVDSISGDFCNGDSTSAYGTYVVRQQLPTEVPEPGTLLLILGGGVLAGVRKRPRNVLRRANSDTP